MCSNTTSELTPCFPMHAASWRLLKKRHNLQVHRLNRRKRSLKKEAKKNKARVMKRDMEIKNWKLYMENKSIIQENEKLQKKALLLNQENQVLLSQLHNNFSHLRNTITKAATTTTFNINNHYMTV